MTQDVILAAQSYFEAITFKKERGTFYTFFLNKFP